MSAPCDCKGCHRQATTSVREREKPWIGVSVCEAHATAMTTVGHFYERGDSIRPGYSPRWQAHGDLIRTQLQETGRVRLSFIMLADLWAAVSDLGIDPTEVGFYAGYAVVGDAWTGIDPKRDLL
jgi:hypothetical protein